MVVAVDEDALLDRIATYDQEHGLFEDHIDTAMVEWDGVSPPDDEVWRDGDVFEWVPTSWSSPCSSGDHVWQSESRVALTSPLANWERPTMVTARRDGSVFNVNCSAVRVGVHWALTAAHCVTEFLPFQQDPTLDVADVRVCTWGNSLTGADCVNVAAIHPHPDFDTTWLVPTDFGDDVALLRLAAPPSSTFAKMVIGSNTSVSGLNVRSFSIGALTPTCQPNVFTPGIDSAVNTGANTWHQEGIDVTYFSGNFARYRADFSQGSSGSPIFHCNGAGCGVKPSVIDAVHAGWNAPYSRWVGSRAVQWRSWALGIIDD